MHISKEGFDRPLQLLLALEVNPGIAVKALEDLLQFQHSGIVQRRFAEFVDQANQSVMIMVY